MTPEEIAEKLMRLGIGHEDSYRSEDGMDDHKRIVSLIHAALAERTEECARAAEDWPEQEAARRIAAAIRKLGEQDG